MNIVVDTNVIVSGLLSPQGNPGKIISAWHDGAYGLVISTPMLDKLKAVLQYPKIKKRLGWQEKQIEQFILMLQILAKSVDITGIKAKVPNDKDDEIFLATLIASEAELLVTGDSDLLALSAQYPIIAPAKFVARLW